jgi:hypothetical protein
MSADDSEPEVFQATAPWNGKCLYCGEDELEGGSDGGECMYCGSITIPPLSNGDRNAVD